MKALGGTWGAVLLPLSDDGSIDFSRLNAELDALLAAGLAGTYTCGTAGEFHTLEEPEFDALSQVVADRSRQAGVPFHIGASHMSGQVCLSRIRRARALSPAAIQVTLPDWLPLSPAEVDNSIEMMAAEAGPVPLVLYNPPHAKTVCTVGQLAGLCHRFGLAGVKVAGPLSFYRQLHEAAPGLAIFVPGHELAQAWGRG